MSKKLKKILSGALSAAVIAGSVPMTAISAFAQTTDEETETHSDSAYVAALKEHFTADGVIPFTKDDIDEDHIISSVSDYREKLGLSGDDTSGGTIASKWDNSTNENSIYLPKVRNQDQLGACCSWASVYYQFTYTTNKARGVATTDENTYSPNFPYNFLNRGRNKGTPLIGNYSVLMYQGTPALKDFPLIFKSSPETNFRSWFATGDIWEKATHNRMLDFDVFSAGGYDASETDFWLSPIPLGHTVSDPKDSNLDTLKMAIQNGELITFCSPIFGWADPVTIKSVNQNDKTKNPNGYKIDNSQAGKLTTRYIYNDKSYHQMNIVGYNDEIWTDINGNGIVDKGEMGAFKIVNSWGENLFGDKGFMWLAYDAINLISSVANAPAVSDRTYSMISVARMVVSGKKDDSSGIYLKYVFNTDNRQAVDVIVSAKAKNGNTTNTMRVSPYNAQRSYDTYDCNYNYEGTTGYSDGTMYFDLNNVVSDINSDNLNNYNWTVTITDDNQDNSKLTVKEMKIVDRKSDMEYDMNSSSFVLDGSSKTVTIPVSSDPVQDAVVIYYKGYSTPYIHYRAGTGTWTTAPGFAMTKTSEVSGYTHKYTIDLGTASYAEVCFNDGNGNWDSRNGANYIFNEGCYTFSNGNIQPYTPPVPQALSLDLSLSDTTVPAGGTFTVKANAKGGTAPYQYRYSYVKNSTETQVKDYTQAVTSVGYTIPMNGTYTVKVSVKDAAGKTVEKTATVNVVSVNVDSVSIDKTSPKAGDKIRVGSQVTTGGAKLTYRYTVTGNGSTETLTTNSDYSAYWTPSKEGTYTVKLELYFGTKPLGSKSISVTVEKGEVSANTTTIYYKGYSNPYIHFRAGTGTWTTAPGFAMTKTSEVSGYTHKYTIDLGTASYAEVCFNDGNNSWDSNNGANYKFTKGTYTFSNGSITIYNPPQPTELTASVSVSSKYVPTNRSFTATAKASGGTAPYQYRFTTSYKGNETVLQDYSSNSVCTTSIGQYASYTLFVTVKDATGKTVQAKTDLVVTYANLKKLTADKETVKTGEKVRFTAETETNNIPVTLKYTVKKKGASTYTTLTTNSDNTAAWVPKEEGTYDVCCEMMYNNITISSLTISYTVEKGEVSANTTTIYYKGYSNPYIHFRAGTGTWTTAPGFAMTKTSEISGYTHKYTIDLGTASYAEVCFNDGNGSWDSNNGANYKFNKGTYTFSNGKITTYTSPQPTELSVNLSLSDTYVPANGNFTISAAAQGGTAPYQYQFSYSGSYETNLQSYSSTSKVNCSIPQNGKYTVKVIAKDSTGKTVQKTATVNVVAVNINSLNLSKTSPKTGENVTLSSNVTTNNVKVSYRYSVVNSSGILTSLTTTSSNTAVWTPTAEGKYTARVEIYFGDKPLGSKSVSVTVEKGEVTVNATTIYYKGYSTPNIHYRVGSGSWTAVPGKPMERASDLSGFTHKYTINLGTATYAEVCFNDGRGNWDSRNGANYRFEKGTYAYSGGSITRISTASGSGSTAFNNVALKNLSAVSEEIVTLGETITVNANAVGGSGDYTYTVSYKKKSSDKWTAKQYYKANNVVTIKPAAAAEYEICVKVKDSAGKIVKKYFTVKAVKKLTNTSTISAAAIKKGEAVTLNCSAKGGEGSYTYTVSYKKKTSEKWTAKQYFSENDTVTIKPASAVDYEICVKAKDSKGTVTKNYFDVSVSR